MFRKGRLLLLSGLTVFAVACGDDEVTQLEEDGQEDTATDVETDDDEGFDLEGAGTDEEMTSLTVEMYNSDSTRVGRAILDQTEEGVTLTLNLEDMPAGEYAMHIHEVGLATPPTFEDAGGHFNPTDASHGFDHEDGHHLGDLPNLTIPENGIVNEVIQIPDVSLLPDVDYTLATENGTSLIIHTEADDYETQPTGDAGERMAGGVIFSPQE